MFPVLCATNEDHPEPSGLLPSLGRIVHTLATPNGAFAINATYFWDEVLLPELQALNAITEIFPTKSYVMAHPYGSVDSGPRLYIGYDPEYPDESDEYYSFHWVEDSDSGLFYLRRLGVERDVVAKDAREHKKDGSMVKVEVVAYSTGELNTYLLGASPQLLTRWAGSAITSLDCVQPWERRISIQGESTFIWRTEQLERLRGGSLLDWFQTTSYRERTEGEGRLRDRFSHDAR